MNATFLSSLLFGLLFIGCCGVSGERSNSVNNAVITSFLNSSCGDSTMQSGLAHDALTNLGSGTRMIYNDTYASGDGYEITIMYSNRVEQITYKYIYYPDAQAKYADNEDARRVAEECMQD